ncbi:hypothetical protein FCM35_KLT09127 [Carex littledalei]|uniref:Uncharacterized protein n=1 Tax=Carex littledalei TaxID=544730 RepID=A0A833QQC0_9POAL|nr:hypothetical protein FCM35_KLT09127 [Carex littledalei]
MASSGSNLQSTKDASGKIDSVKLPPNKESSEETITVKTVDISQSAGQTQDVTRPVEIVHETLATEDATSKKETPATEDATSKKE